MPERGWGVRGMNPWFSRLRRLGWRLRRRLPFPLKFTAREWRTLLERLPVVVYQALADEQGSTIFAAGAVEEVLGYTPLEWTARPGAWYEALHPDDRRRVMRRLRRMRADESTELVYRIRHRAGEWRWIRDTVTLFETARGRRYYLGVMTDITHERELEQATREIKVFLDELLRSGPWVLYRLEGPRQEVRYLSPNAEAVLGLAPAEVMGHTPEGLVERVHPEDRSLFRRHFALLRQVGKDQTRIRLEVRPREYRWMLMNAQRASSDPEVYLGYLMDIEEKAQNEASLRRHIERQQALYELGNYAWESARPQGFFERAIETLDRVLHPEFIAVMEYLPAEQALEVRAAKRVPVGHRFGLFESQAGYTLRMNEPVVATDLGNEERFAVPEELVRMGVASTLSVPIPGEEGPYGVLGIGYPHRRSMDEVSVRFVQSVAQLMGQVLRYRKVLGDLEHKAYYDDLTGLPNRRALYREISRVLSDPERSGIVAFLDLADFGEVNDIWGHEMGDQLLRRVGERLRAFNDRGVWSARWGGDEFVAILQGEEALQRLKSCMARLAEPIPLQGQRIQLGMRAGVVRFREHGSDTETLLRRADMALAVAKEQNRPIYVYEAGLQEQAARRRARVEALRRALLAGDEMFLFFQPIVHLREGHVTAAEALLRWRDPETGELVPPSEFIPLAERYGLGAALDRKVLELALETGVRWLELWGDAAPRLSVNASPESILEPRFFQELVALLRRFGYPADRLVLEITERVIADVERTQKPLERLRSLGLRVAVDDFGTGYSSLAYLAYLNVDVLKVDRAFIKDIGRNRRTEAVLRSIFALGDNLGLPVTAEGVERPEQLDWLRRAGCTSAQGYHVGRPMDARAFEAWWSQRG